MEQKKPVTDKTYWHPVFFAGIRMELKKDKPLSVIADGRRFL